MSRFTVACVFGMVLGSLAASVQAAESVWSYSSPAGYVDSSPALGDIDGNGELDIVLGSTSGGVSVLDVNGRLVWHCDVGDSVTIAPTLADVAGDRSPEVLVLTLDGHLICLSGESGRELWRWSAPAPVTWGTTAVVATDLDGDGVVEIVTGDSEGTTACLSAAGDVRWLYHGEYGGTLCPAIGDLDGDGQPEIIVAGDKIPLVCLSAQGHELWRVGQSAQGASPVLCDLNDDGVLEILGALDKSLAAFGPNGSVLWTVPMKNTVDSAITVADADEDGTIEIYAVDLAGHLVCVTPDGKLRWSANVEERARRSPAVADVDGDGVCEILVAGYSAALHVFDPAGVLEERIALPAPCNATATVVDLAGDGTPSVLCATGGGETVVYRWPDAKPGAKNPWPEYRLDSTRNAVVGAPAEAMTVAIADVDFGDFYVGPNYVTLRVINPEGRPLTIRVEVLQNGDNVGTSVLSSTETEIVHEAPYALSGREVVNLALSCTVTEGERVLAKRARQVYVVPFAKELSDAESMVAAFSQVVSNLPAPREMMSRVWRLERELADFERRAELAGTVQDTERRSLRDDIAALRAECVRWTPVVLAAVDSGSALVVSVANPWAPFGGLDEIVEGRLAQPRAVVEAFGGETEAAAFNVFNFSSTPKTVRVTLDDFVSGVDAAVTLPASQVVSLHEAVSVPTQKSDLSADALPRLNEAQTMVVPGWAGRQLWVNVDTSPLAPGTWKGRIQFKTLEVDPLETTAELSVTVWDAKLPEQHALRSCQWGYVHSSILKDQPDAAFDDQVAHGTNVFVGLFYPQAAYDENGALVGAIDFAAHDAYVTKHAPAGIILFCGYQGALKGPGDHQSEAYRKAHVAWLRAWVAHLAELGVGYDGFALYPVDEPGLRDGLVDVYLNYARLAREADPKILMYTDPVAGIELAQLAAMTPYVDIWCPNRNGFLLEDSEKFDLIKATGKTLWTYECEGNAKHQSPLGYYRAQSWLAWHHGLTGIGFWSYCTSRNDPWYVPTVNQDYILIYQGSGVVASKRWEAVRDGMEDYDMLKALRDAYAPGALPEDVAVLLGGEASAIASFCGLDEDGNTPGEGGLAERREIADRRWTRLQGARRQVAAALAAAE